MSEPSQDRFFRFQEYGIHFVDEGQGEPVIFLHCLGGSLDLWDQNLSYFLQRKFRVMAFDFLGCGRSDRPDVGYSLELLSDSLLAFLEDRGVDQAVLVGNSVGGHVAMHLAASQPMRVKALVLANASGCHSTARRLLSSGILWSAQIGRHLPLNPPQVVMELALSHLHGTDGPQSKFLSDYYGRQMEGDDGLRWKRAFVRTLESLLSTPVDDEIRETHQPTLIVWGKRDRLLGDEGGSALKKLIPHSELVTFEDAGHFPQLEQPEIFNETVSRFLARVKSGQS